MWPAPPAAWSVPESTAAGQLRTGRHLPCFYPGRPLRFAAESAVFQRLLLRLQLLRQPPLQRQTPRDLHPRELAELTIGFYRRNYIEGLFLSSAVLGTPDRTMELMIEALRILREEYL